LTKVFRITLAFDPVSTVDVLSEDIETALKKVLAWLKENGNEVDSTIFLGAELISEINPLVKMEKAEPSEEDQSEE
jgi:hypothetical protein